MHKADVYIAAFYDFTDLIFLFNSYLQVDNIFKIERKVLNYQMNVKKFIKHILIIVSKIICLIKKECCSKKNILSKYFL
jgi:hypothetical protein